MKNCFFEKIRLVLTMVLVLAFAGVSFAGEDACEMPSSLQLKDGVYQISNCGDLYKFADVVKNASSGKICAKLTDNITVNDKVLDAKGQLNGNGEGLTSWTPIKVTSGKKVTLDGNGHTISGLYFNNEKKDYVGLFGEVNGTVSVSNLGIVDSYFKGKYYVGGLVGYNNGGTLTIENSYNSGSVSGDYYVGGLVGYSYNGTLTIENSYNSGTVSGDFFVGGLVGRNGVSGKLTITNSFFLATDKIGDKLGGEAKTLDDFHNGTVAMLLHYYVQTDCEENCIDGTVWGQDLTKENSLPDFSSEFVGGTPEFYAQWMKLNEKGCYEIGTAFELYGFANVVNNATDGSQICGKLTKDIVVNKGVLNDGTLNGVGSNFTPWTPMNVKSGVQVTLNGNGKTISGLYFNDENQDNVGLFGDVLGTVSISNLGVKDSYFKGGFNVGGLVGRNNGGSLSIENSYNAGTVSGNSCVGGLVGANEHYSTLTITNSYNSGTVHSSDSYVGGLVGCNVGANAKLTITNSYNEGTVSGNGIFVGGLVGYNGGENAKLTIKNSYNAGPVSGSGDNVGGLVGCSNGESLTIENSYNSGTVSGVYYVGGLVGYNYGKLTITNSFFVATGKIGDDLGGKAKSVDEFRNGSVALSLHDWCEMDGDECKDGGLNGLIWGQNVLNGDLLPNFSCEINAVTQELVLRTFEGDTRKYPTEYIAGLELPTGLTREGFVFLGWSSKEVAESFSDIVTSIASDATGKKEFYAQWKEFDANGCFAIASAIELYAFANVVNNATEGEVCGTLVDNIVVNTSVLKTNGALNGNGSSFTPWTPMNVQSGVQVTFNGKGKTISGLYFNDENQDNVGLFGEVTGALSISDLGVKDSYFKGGSDVGGLVGSNSGELTITNSYNAGSVSGGENFWYVGGLVGYNFSGSLSIENSYNAGTVSGGCVGGLVGDNVGSLTITNSFFLATGEYNVYYGGTETSLDDFHNGTVARNLHDWCEKEEGSETCKVGGKNGSIWGQDLAAENSLPDLSGKIGHKYGSVVFFDKKADGTFGSAHVDATSELAVDFPNDVVVSGPVKFKRTFAGSGGYSTIMLPFTPNCTDDDCVEGVKFYEFGSYANASVGITEVSPSALKANTPYLVSAAGATELVFKNGGTFNTTTGEYKKDLVDDEGNVIGWTIYGTYEYKTWEKGDAGLGRTYGFAANDGVNNPAIVGQFAKVGAGAHIYPMRAYLEYVAPVKQSRPAANGAARAGAANTVASLPETINVVIVDKDETSGEQTTRVIGTINTRTGEFMFADDRWFDLNGRYLGNKKPTQKGAYYNNGKKVIVK